MRFIRTLAVLITAAPLFLMPTVAEAASLKETRAEQVAVSTIKSHAQWYSKYYIDGDDIASTDIANCQRVGKRRFTCPVEFNVRLIRTLDLGDHWVIEDGEPKLRPNRVKVPAVWACTYEARVLARKQSINVTLRHQTCGYDGDVRLVSGGDSWTKSFAR